MRYLHNSAIGTAMLAAATAAGCIVAFLSVADPRYDALIAGEAAAAIAMVWLLASALVIYFLTLRRSRANPAAGGSTAGHGDGAASMRRRREVLEERLNIDEPRLCSQFLVACTCWSFCARSAGKSPVGEGTAVHNLVPAHKPPPQVNDLPLVHRSGSDNCPFRYAPTRARAVPPDGGAPISSGTGTDTR